VLDVTFPRECCQPIEIKKDLTEMEQNKVMVKFDGEPTESEVPMAMPLDLGLILRFLTELSQHNQKAWFDENRPAYETARDTFYLLINDLIDEFRASDHLLGISARECVARIYRDIRFSKDKSPYKTNLAAMIAPGGWKPTRLGYYLSIQPQAQSLIAGGLYDPTPEQLNRFREAMARDASTFNQLTSALDFVEVFGKVEGEQLKTAPRGYDPAHPEIALLRLKQITAIHRFSDQEILASDYEGKVIAACRAMKPFLDYLNDIVS
jgi:uncharacterized protein (TIGR02453 family)